MSTAISLGMPELPPARLAERRPTRQLQVGSVPVGPGPTSVAVAPDGRTAWVTNAQGGSVSVLTLA